MRYVGWWRTGEVMVPPVGNDPTHKPLKTRLSLEFSSCNRRILVYGLVYDQDPRECHTPYWVNVYVPDPRLGFWECQFRGMCLKGCS